MITFLVSRIVSVPSTSNSSSLFFVTVLLVNVITGNLATEKKSSLRRCASRSGVPVSMLAVLIENLSEDAAAFAGSNWTVPVKSVKWPRTFVSRWRTWKPTSECVLSIVKVLAAVAMAFVVI